MDNKLEFRKYLKSKGKKQHVVDQLIEHVQLFEHYLASNRNTQLGETKEKDILAYINCLDKKVAKKRIRGLALYFRFTKQDTLAKFASAYREKEIATTRQSFKLRYFRDINPAVIEQLKVAGITTVEDMLEAGKTPTQRFQLSEQTGVALSDILELVKLSDLSRLGAVKSVRARLYYNAGLDIPEKFKEWDPEDLRQMLVEFVERADFDGIPPLPKEIRNVIAKAHKLPVCIQYDE